MQRVAFGLACLFSLILSSCSSLTHSKNEEAVAKVKRIALTGLSIIAPVPAGFRTGKERAHSDEIYSALAKSFATNMKWKVVPVEQMRADTTYRKAYDDTMKGFQNKMPVPDKKRLYTLEGVMDDDCARILGKDGRNAVMRALAVDALVTTRVEVMLNGTAVMGIGNLYPQVRASFMLYKIDSDTPEWFEGDLLGAQSKASVGASAFFDEALLHKEAVISAKSAFARIGAR